MPASVSVVSSRASGAPFRTATHSVTYTAVTVPVTSDFTSTQNFGSRLPTTSTLSVRVEASAAITVTATAGRVVVTGAAGVSFEQPADAATSASAAAKDR